MRKMSIFISAAVLAIAGCSSEQDSSTHDSVIVSNVAIENDTTNRETLLLPGVSAGNIKINEDAAPVYTNMGKPDAGDAAMQKAVAIWYKNHDPKSDATAVFSVRDTGDNPVARVKQIRTTSPEFKTGSGIGVNSALADIQEEYTVKKLAGYTDEKHKTEIYDSSSGIAFEIGTDLKCKAVLIHPAGEELKATYLPLRE
ncbi:MAG TPA: hypothetical protein VKB19_05440 [Pedobacter sp.]|nr:hypothetical protein [Pedobacter sp.]